MLNGIHPALIGPLLAHLDAMGHSDAVVIADAHFPAERLSTRCIELPCIGAPQLVSAIRTVLPLDDAPALDLMQSADGSVLEVQTELMGAAAVTSASTRFLERHAFYENAASAFVIVRTGETRSYGNAILRKGLVGAYRQSTAEHETLGE